MAEKKISNRCLIKSVQKDSLKNSSVELSKRTKVIACEVFKDELEHLGISQTDCLFLEQGLHRHPRELNKRLAQMILKVEEEYSPQQIILVYGYCGGGLEGIRASNANLIFAKVHDCIALFLGHEPKGIGSRGAGVYFLTRGWLNYGRTPYTDYLQLRERIGYDEAFWRCQEILKNYHLVAFIHTLPNSCSELKKQSKKIADFFEMEHSEIESDLGLLKNLLRGQPRGDIVKIGPNCIISKKDFR
jgi:hypothetical protein